MRVEVEGRGFCRSRMREETSDAIEDADESVVALVLGRLGLGLLLRGQAIWRDGLPHGAVELAEDLEAQISASSLPVSRIAIRTSKRDTARPAEQHIAVLQSVPSKGD